MFFNKKKVDEQKRRRLNAELNGVIFDYFDIDFTQQQLREPKPLSLKEKEVIGTSILAKIERITIESDQVIHYKDSTGRITDRVKSKGKIKIIPKLKFNAKGWSIQFDSALTLSNINLIQDQIINEFYVSKIIDSDRVDVNPSPNPYIINYSVLRPLQVHPIKVVQDDPKGWENWLKKSLEVECELYLGQSTDPSIMLDTELMVENLSSAPHFMIIGQTRSGKTKSVLNLVSQFALRYPKSVGHFYFGDGKPNGTDWFDSASKLSNYKVAQISPEGDPMVELANLIKAVDLEYTRRQNLMREASDLGFNCSTYFELKAHVKRGNLDSRFDLPRAVLMIDEFATWIASTPDSISNLIKTKGSIYNRLDVILRTAASFGFTVIIASQKAQESDFPPSIRSNLTVRLIHNCGPEDQKFLGVEGQINSFNTGDYLLQFPGLFCQKDGRKNRIKAKLPYIGDTFSFDLPPRDHIAFDYDLIYPTTSKSALDLSKSTDEHLARVIKTTLLKAEGLNIIEEYKDYDAIKFKFELDKKHIQIGLIDKDEAIDDQFLDRLELLGQNLDCPTVWFVRGQLTPSNQDKVISNVNSLDIVLFEQDYLRLLDKSLDLYYSSETQPLLTNYLRSKLSQIEASKVESKVDNVIVSVAELDRIVALKGKSDSQKIEKGQQFEDIAQAILSTDHHVWSSDELFQQGYKRNKGGKGDNGLDLLLIPRLSLEEPRPDLKALTEAQSQSRIAAQCKNWSVSLDAKVLGEILRSYGNFKCLTFGSDIQNGALIHTGPITEPAVKEAKNLGIRLINQKGLEKMILKSQDKKEEPVEVNYTSIKTLQNEGKSIRSIAEELGLSPSKVSRILKKGESK